MKTTPPPLVIVQQKEPIYMAPPTPVDHNNNKLVTPYAVTMIVRNPDVPLDIPTTPVTPITPYTPSIKSGSFFDHDKDKYFYNSAHTLVRPVKDSAPKEAPPPTPYSEYATLMSTLSLVGEAAEPIYAELHIGG